MKSKRDKKKKSVVNYGKQSEQQQQQNTDLPNRQNGNENKWQNTKGCLLKWIYTFVVNTNSIVSLFSLSLSFTSLKWFYKRLKQNFVVFFFFFFSVSSFIQLVSSSVWYKITTVTLWIMEAVSLIALVIHFCFFVRRHKTYIQKLCVLLLVMLPIDFTVISKRYVGIVCVCRYIRDRGVKIV